jgi:hypothetical protein
MRFLGLLLGIGDGPPGDRQELHDRDLRLFREACLLRFGADIGTAKEAPAWPCSPPDPAGTRLAPAAMRSTLIVTCLGLVRATLWPG